MAKIITGLGLALLLVVAAWSASHSEAEGVLPSGGAAAAVSHIGSAALVGDDAVPPIARHEPTAATAVADTGTSPAGTAGCLLGVLCTIVLMALIRRVGFRRAAPLTSALLRTVRALSATHRPFLRAVTLSELSVSRI